MEHPDSGHGAAVPERRLWPPRRASHHRNRCDPGGPRSRV